MSMFHELMMRKKEEIMYATIKGTLTENDGVFSGFSASNYLLVQDNIDFEKNWEFELEITTGNDVSNQYVIFSASQNFMFTLFSNNKGFLYYAKTDGTRTYKSTNSTFATNTKYKIRVKYDGSKIYLYVNGILEIQDNSNFTGYSVSRLGLGQRPSASGLQYFNGSIDLNNSYIKLGSTKYNLQAVVGYTVVGSPTITDGVVSGFSSANYLKINVPSGITYTNIELGFKFKTTDRTKRQDILINSSNFIIIISSNIVSINTINANTNNWTSNSGGTITNNEWWWYIVTIDNTNKTIQIKRSQDGTNFTTFATLTNVPLHDTRTLNTAGIFQGNTDNSQYMTLDMNFNYIKINNKLWFNGQQS